ncbi:pyridoxamine 5'-phosphate oxidase family protein [Catenovulum sp. SM1970]|uniref:pyridoxamine 5'-phosphate oxidase family protein n=1 Tax=Marinifaba aquimaris TaxID=2741323 RepID=UPI0015739D97|nr:pyridoxamine 5'-phosphate oxidase family protein [Marinifaba aquimaris]NTS76781.1 pyridoxamine 5'-phosphate oxidase family protein [Marinifaba aquimaris]
MLTNDVLTAIEDSVLCWLATADKDGFPNVSPKEIFVAHGESTLLIAHIASPHSIKNIKQNPKVCVSFVDVFKQKGYKVKGQATLLTQGSAEYQQALPKLHKLAGDAFVIQAIIEVSIDSCKAILAPSYLFNPETKQSDQIASAMQTYGVKPL